jgi:hypothetical protein
MVRSVFGRFVTAGVASVVVALAGSTPAHAGGCSSVSISIGGGHRHGGHYGGHYRGHYSSCAPRRTYSCGPTYVYDSCAPVYYRPRYSSGWSVGLSYNGRLSDNRGYSRDDWSSRDDRSGGDSYYADASSVQTYRNDSRSGASSQASAYRDWQNDTAASKPTVVRNTALAVGGTATDSELAAVSISSTTAAAPAREGPQLASSNGARPAAAPVNSTAQPTAALAQQDGWALLDSGDFKQASKVFAVQAASGENNGSARVGYALSATMLGDLDTAAWAMRRAFVSNADAVGFVPLGESMSARLEEAANTVRAKAEQGRDADRWFLLASVEYLRRKTDDSAAALAKAVAMGDAHQSTESLIRLVGADTVATVQR